MTIKEQEAMINRAVNAARFLETDPTPQTKAIFAIYDNLIVPLNVHDPLAYLLMVYDAGIAEGIHRERERRRARTSGSKSADVCGNSGDPAASPAADQTRQAGELDNSRGTAAAQAATV